MAAGDPEQSSNVLATHDVPLVWSINKGCGGAAGTPWVGAKQSGYGYHSGREGHRQFTQSRVVSTPK